MGGWGSRVLNFLVKIYAMFIWYIRLVDRPTQLICISDIYLLSWRWWPLWSGGLLYQWSMRPKKQAGSDFFEKYLRPWRSKKQDKKRAKTLKKGVLSALLTISATFGANNFWGQQLFAPATFGANNFWGQQLFAPTIFFQLFAEITRLLSLFWPASVGVYKFYIA